MICISKYTYNVEQLQWYRVSVLQILRKSVALLNCCHELIDQSYIKKIAAPRIFIPVTLFTK